jgi:hypothetical protein
MKITPFSAFFEIYDSDIDGCERPSVESTPAANAAREKKAMRYSRTVCVALLGLLGVAALGTSPARADDCKELLDNNRYSCSFKNENASSGSFCAQVDASNPAAGKFTIDDGVSTYQCTCVAKGNFKSPKFNEDREFLCGNLELGNALTGKVVTDGEKIKEGEFFCNDSCDFLGVFECEIDPACVDE